MSVTKELPPRVAELNRMFLRLVQYPPLHGLSTRQLCILFQAYEKPCTIRGLSDAMKVEKAALSRGGDVLEELDLVKRREEADDRRGIELIITPKGRRLVEKFSGL